MELKHVLARQPGPEAAEQLQIYRHTLRERTKQLKVSGRTVAMRVPPGCSVSPAPTNQLFSEFIRL